MFSLIIIQSREQKDYWADTKIKTVNILGLIQSHLLRKDPDSENNPFNIVANIIGKFNKNIYKLTKWLNSMEYKRE